MPRLGIVLVRWAWRRLAIAVHWFIYLGVADAAGRGAGRVFILAFIYFSGIFGLQFGALIPCVAIAQFARFLQCDSWGLR